MTGILQPLDQKFPIVSNDGRPTLYFIKWAQQRMLDIGIAVSEQQAKDIANLAIQAFDTAHELQAGNGISITPDGHLSSDPTISAKVQEILDQITSARGSVLFRGATEWQALAPGTSGQFLRTNGAGADPTWATGGGGGGGVFTTLSRTSDYPISSVPALSIPWQSAIVDTAGAWSIASASRITVPSGVSYAEFTFGIRMGADYTANSTLVLTIYKNGDAAASGRYGENQWNVGNFSTASGSCSTAVVPVSAGDYFECRINSFGDTSFNVLSNPSTFFSAKFY